MSLSSITRNIKKYGKANPLVVFLLVLLIAGAIYMIIQGVHDRKAGKLPFMNRGSGGWLYDTDTMQFAKPADRLMGQAAVLKMLNADGSTYTLAQIATLSDSVVLMLLDPEDDQELFAMKAKLSMVLDPTYKPALAIIDSAVNHRGGKFASINEREIVYKLIVKYFSAMQTPVSAPLFKWSDAILIRTFKSLKMPLASELTGMSSASKFNFGIFDLKSSISAANIARKTSKNAKPY